jgi:hypothetical protein
MRLLQEAFDDHWKTAHMAEDADRSSPNVATAFPGYKIDILDIVVNDCN